MKKTSASLLAGISVLVFTAASVSAQTYVDLSKSLYSDNFESYASGDTPPLVSVGTSGTYTPTVVVDSGNLFGSGVGNQYLEYRKARHTTFMIDFEPSEVVRLSFDFISRNLPADGTYDADGRWLSIPFFADPTGEDVSNNARANLNQLVVRNATIRGDGSSYGNVDELVHFDMFFNNSNDAIEYDAPDGQVVTLSSGDAAIWADNVLIVDSYNSNRTAGTLGYGVHRLGFQIDSNADGIVSFDMDNVEVFGVIPEPSTYALFFGGLALAGAVYVRRRRV